jgi:hypothetical protein
MTAFIRTHKDKTSSQKKPGKTLTESVGFKILDPKKRTPMRGPLRIEILTDKLSS